MRSSGILRAEGRLLFMRWCAGAVVRTLKSRYNFRAFELSDFRYNLAQCGPLLHLKYPSVDGGPSGPPFLLLHAIAD